MGFFSREEKIMIFLLKKVIIFHKKTKMSGAKRPFFVPI
jgi:hypothetical protein